MHRITGPGSGHVVGEAQSAVFKPNVQEHGSGVAHSPALGILSIKYMWAANPIDIVAKTRDQLSLNAKYKWHTDKTKDPELFYHHLLVNILKWEFPLSL